MSSSDLDPALLAAIQEAVAAGMAAQPLAEPPPAIGLQMSITPKLGLKQPALDDPALITDLNDNMTILDEAITASAAATLTNKTLVAPVITNPTITGWANAVHNHLDPAGAGILDGAAVASGYVGTGDLVRETALTDGSFAGAELVAPVLFDPVVRDQILFGEQGTEAPPDSTILRTGPKALSTDANWAVGVPPAPWHAAFRAVQAETAFLMGIGSDGHLGANTYGAGGGVWKASTVAPAVRVDLAGGRLAVFTAPATALAGDTQTFTERMRLDLAGNLGVGVAPVGWGAGYRVLQIGQGSSFWGDASGSAGSYFSANTYHDGTNFRAFINAPATHINIGAGNFQLNTAPIVAAGAAQTFTTRLTVDQAGRVGVGTPVPVDFGAGSSVVKLGMGGFYIGQDNVPNILLSANSYYPTAGGPYSMGNYPGQQLWLSQDGYLRYYQAPAVAPGVNQVMTQRLSIDSNGTVALNPVAGQHAIVGTGSLSLSANSGRLQLSASSQLVVPSGDAYYYLGYSDARWHSVWSQTGGIQTSLAEAKQDITPLDPAACYQAAKDVRWYDFRYRPPAFTPPEPGPDTAYDEHDSNEVKAEKKVLRDEAEAQALAAHAKMLLETAPARHQRGFVFPVGVEAQDEAGGSLPPVPDLFGLDDRESTTPQADLATLGCALQEVIRRLETLEAAAA